MFSHSLIIVLHPRLMNEVKSHPHLSFDEATKRVSKLLEWYRDLFLTVPVIFRGTVPWI